MRWLRIRKTVKEKVDQEAHFDTVNAEKSVALPRPCCHHCCHSALSLLHFCSLVVLVVLMVVLSMVLMVLAVLHAHIHLFSRPSIVAVPHSTHQTTLNPTHSAGLMHDTQQLFTDSRN
jgi:hypothetical protein